MHGLSFNLPNAGAEVSVRIRFLFFSLGISLATGLLGGIVLVSLGHGQPPNLGLELFAVDFVVLFALAFGLSYLSARAVVQDLTPVAIAIEADRVVGNFRRPRYGGPTEREIRLEDVRAIRKTYVLRIPMVRGHRDFRRNKPIQDAAAFYLTESNLELVRRAVEAAR